MWKPHLCDASNVSKTLGYLLQSTGHFKHMLPKRLFKMQFFPCYVLVSLKTGTWSNRPMNPLPSGSVGFFLLSFFSVVPILFPTTLVYLQRLIWPNKSKAIHNLQVIKDLNVTSHRQANQRGCILEWLSFRGGVFVRVAIYSEVFRCVKSCPLFSFYSYSTLLALKL